MLLSFLLAMGAAVRARAIRNVAYAPVSGAKLDVYTPVGADGEAPVVVFADCRSKRRLFRSVGQTLASRGFVTLIPDVRGPEPLGHVAQAVAWAWANAGRFGGDPQRLFLMGHADGAASIAMLAMDPRWLDAVGMTPRDLRGAVGICGLYDDVPAQGVDLAPPLLLIAAQNDRIDPESTGRLARAIRSRSGRVTEIRFPRLGDRLGARMSLGGWSRRSTALDEVERFVRLYSLGSGR